MPNGDRKNLLERIGCEVSSFVSDLSAHPFAQVAVVLVCALWFIIGFATELLTAILSILAITLSQMVLNRQNERESEAHRRDVAMHAKLDELLISVKDARNEMVGIEDLEEEEIEELKEEAKLAIDAAGDQAGEPHEREVAKKAVEAASRRVRAGAMTSKSRKKARAKAA